MLVGHTKFSPDRFFGLFKKAYWRSSVSPSQRLLKLWRSQHMQSKTHPSWWEMREEDSKLPFTSGRHISSSFFVPYLTFSHTTSLGSHLLNRGWCTFASIVIQMKRKSTFWRASTAIFLVFQTKPYLPDLTSTGSGICMSMYDHTVKALLRQILPVQSHHSISHHKVGPPLLLKMRQPSLQQSGVYVASVINRDTIRSPAQLSSDVFFLVLVSYFWFFASKYWQDIHRGDFMDEKRSLPVVFLFIYSRQEVIYQCMTT